MRISDWSSDVCSSDLPTMSCTLSTNSGSVDSLNVSDRCGCRPNAPQIRRMVVCDSPDLAAMERIDQCVASLGSCSAHARSPEPLACQTLFVADPHDLRQYALQFHPSRTGGALF